MSVAAPVTVSRADKAHCLIRVGCLIGMGIGLQLVPLKLAAFVFPLFMLASCFSIGRPSFRECYGRRGSLLFGLAMAILLTLVWWARLRTLFGLDRIGVEDLAFAIATVGFLAIFVLDPLGQTAKEKL